MTDNAQKQKKDIRPKCGIVMPISGMDDLTPDHWSEVKGLIVECAEECGFVSDLVSAADFSGVIQKRIVQNLYGNDLVICDVSKQNANVMFELGLRLAFDKATIVIVDDETPISFDTSPIEHLIYPRDLRHGKILLFKEKLKGLINGTFAKSKEPGYSTFLKDFGTFEVKGLDSKDIQFDEYVQTSLEKLALQVSMLVNQNNSLYRENRAESSSTHNVVKKIVNDVISSYIPGIPIGLSEQEFNGIEKAVIARLEQRGIDRMRFPYQRYLLDAINKFNSEV